LTDEHRTTDAAQIDTLRARLAAKKAELRGLLEAMPHHTVRVHQQMALEEAEDEVRALEQELATLEGGA
jgi:hypothetical protein